MRNIGLVLVVFYSLLPSMAHASDAEAFNAAWKDYVAAIEIDDTERRVEAAEKVVNLGKSIFDESDERLVVITHNYGVALSDSGDRKQAIPVLEEALRLGEINYGEDGAGLIPIIADLADAEAKVFSPAKQMRLYRRALGIAESSFGEQSSEYADLAFRTARNVYSMSMSMDAQKYMSKARDIYSSLPEPNVQNTALAEYYLGKMEFSGRDYRRSTEYLESALAGFGAPDSSNQAFRLLTRALLVQTYEHRGLSDKATQHCIAIGRDSQLSPDQDYTPIFRVAPRYPESMLRAGRTGYVDLKFTVDRNGFVKEPEVVYRSVDGKEKKKFSDFDKPAMDAVKKFRYAPRFVDGEAVDSSGVQTRIRFAIER